MPPVLTPIPARAAKITTSLMGTRVLINVQIRNGAIRKTINVKPVHLLVKTVKVQAIDVPLASQESSCKVGLV